MPVAMYNGIVFCVDHVQRGFNVEQHDPALEVGQHDCSTVEPPNNGRIGSGHFVLYIEVVLYQKRRQTRPINQGLSISELVYTMLHW